MHLITYDITSNSLRAKLGYTLIEHGYERIQKSVFIGLLNPNKISILQKLVSTINIKKDSILIIKIPVTNVLNMTKFGILVLDLEYLCDKKKSLII